MACGNCDRPPIHHVGFCSEVASKLLGREAHVGGGIQQWREALALLKGPDAHAEYVERSYRDAMELAELAGNDMVRASYWRLPAQPTRRLDENTILCENGPEEDWLVVRFDLPSEQCALLPVKAKVPSYESLEADLRRQEGSLPALSLGGAYVEERRALADLGGRKAVRAGGGGIGIPHDAIWLGAVAERPDLVGRLLDIQVARAEKVIAFLAECGLKYIFGGGDFASNDGPFYSPRHFRELFLPRIRRIADACHRCGAFYLFASDGNLWPVADDLFGASGVDGYYEIDRRAGMDLVRLRERFPRLILVGNISSHNVHMGTRQQVADEARACLDEARRCKGVLAGLSNFFVPGTPMENVEAVLAVLLG
jgi:hypothetical protein